ncbi:MAG: TRAP transporter small permease subunit [Alphaproteobacteria bacterium]|nr:TRAP transporter small permease subunit [Alphaproteobacteria bacterium]
MDLINPAGRAVKAYADSIDRMSAALGSVIIWLTLAMVLVQVMIVVLRYVFGEGLILLQESMLYMHGALFLLGAGYTLLRDGHVRVDIVYRDVSPRTKAAIDLIGTYLFLVPFTLTLIAVATPYVEISWAIGERSRETSGIPFVYLLKSCILLFAGLLLLQGTSVAAHAIQRLRAPAAA